MMPRYRGEAGEPGCQDFYKRYDTHRDAKGLAPVCDHCRWEEEGTYVYDEERGVYLCEVCYSSVPDSLILGINPTLEDLSKQISIQINYVHKSMLQ